MAAEVVMPRLGWNREEGALAGWRKQDGEPVTAGEILFEVESDKAIQEIEALESGTLRIPPDSPALHQMVPVGTLLAYLAKPGDVFPWMDNSRRSRRLSPISPRAARRAVELGLDWTGLKGSGRTGRIIESDIRQAAAARSKPSAAEVNASPLARRVAEDLGVNLAQLSARLSGRRIERADVEAAAIAAGKQQTPLSPAADLVSPISTVRRLTAERLSASAQTAAPVTLTTEADATELVHLRSQLKENDAPIVPSYTDILAKIVAQALTQHPQLNARFEGNGIVLPSETNLGIAVDSVRGLLVPVIRSVHSKSLIQIARESTDLIEKVRNGQVSPGDLLGGTFTLTNLGMYEIDAFTPIINLPECAILGIGRIVPKQVVVDAEMERVAIRHMLFLSLTFDHRLVDGAPAARFLQCVKLYVEKPYLWLVI